MDSGLGAVGTRGTYPPAAIRRAARDDRARQERGGFEDALGEREKTLEVEPPPPSERVAKQSARGSKFASLGTPDEVGGQLNVTA